VKKEKQEIRERKNPLNKMMPDYSVYAMSAAEKLLVRVVAFAIGGFVGQVFYGGMFRDGYGEPTAATSVSNAVFFVLAGFAAMKFLIPLYKKSRLNKQQNKLKQQFISLLDSLATSLASGGNVQKSFESAYTDLKIQFTERDFIVRETKQVLDGIAQNIGIEVILKDFGERSGNENIVNFAEVFETCYSKGGNMQTVIIRTHDSIREKIAIYDEIDTKLSSNKMQLNVMSLMPIGIVALLRFTNPSFAAAFSTGLGVVVNTVAIGVFIGAYKFGTKVVSLGR
jgi:tight adherence protein B